MVWNHVDLAANRLSRKNLPTITVLVVDALAFLSFLALLIANGIVASNLMYWGSYRYSRSLKHAILLTYASVPWMFCWYVKQSISPEL